MGFNTEQHIFIQFRLTRCLSGPFFTAEGIHDLYRMIWGNYPFKSKTLPGQAFTATAASHATHSSIQQRTNLETFVSDWVLGNEPIKFTQPANPICLSNQIWQSKCLHYYLQVIRLDLSIRTPPAYLHRLLWQWGWWQKTCDDSALPHGRMEIHHLALQTVPLSSGSAELLRRIRHVVCLRVQCKTPCHLHSTDWWECVVLGTFDNDRCQFQYVLGDIWQSVRLS